MPTDHQPGAGRPFPRRRPVNPQPSTPDPQQVDPQRIEPQPSDSQPSALDTQPIPVQDDDPFAPAYQARREPRSGESRGAEPRNAEPRGARPADPPGDEQETGPMPVVDNPLGDKPVGPDTGRGAPAKQSEPEPAPGAGGPDHRQTPPRTGQARPRRRWPRVLAWSAIPLVLLLVAGAAAGVGWYYSGEILAVTRTEPTYDIKVVEVRDGVRDASGVVLLDGEDADHPQVTGLEWEGGYARLLAGAETTDGGVLREFEPLPDAPQPGTNARLDFYAFPDDLSSVSDLGASRVTFDAPLGELGATYVPGESDRWVILVHGRGASPAETFRLAPVVAAAGHPSLAISYRNDPGAPQDPDGEWGLGWTESADLAAAVEYARANGAQDVVLVGYSMGGAIVGNYLRTEGSADVAGVIYDSPLLSWRDTIDYEAADRGLPSFLTPLASAAVRVRTGIDLGELDQVENADRLDVPVLLVHGTGDATIPAASSNEFAEARPDLVTYLRLDGAEHVQGWNTHRRIYEDAVAGFLAGL